MSLPIAIGLAIVAVAAVAVGALLFGHRSTGVAASAAPAPSGDVELRLTRRVTSAALLAGLTLGLAGLLAAVVGAVVFLGGLALGS